MVLAKVLLVLCTVLHSRFKTIGFTATPISFGGGSVEKSRLFHSAAARCR